MKKCINCATEVEDDVKFCPCCGQMFLEEYYRSNHQNQPIATQDDGSFGWAILGFFIPFAGLILCLLWRNTRPLDSKRAGGGALVMFIFSIVVLVVLAIVIICNIANSENPHLRPSY